MNHGVILYCMLITAGSAIAAASGEPWGIIGAFGLALALHDARYV